MTYFQAIANQKEEAIDRVLELHQLVEKICDHCDGQGCNYNYCLECKQDYPCSTVKAIKIPD